MTMINVWRDKNGLIRWGGDAREGSTLVAHTPYWEAAKAAVRLLSMGEFFDGRKNVDGKLVPLSPEENAEYVKLVLNEI